MHANVRTSTQRNDVRRYCTFVLVVTFHVALVLVLLRLSPTLPASPHLLPPLELLIFPSANKHADITPPVSSAITVPTTPAPAEGSNAIDWANEAHEAAQAMSAPNQDARLFDHRMPEAQQHSHSIFDEQSAHHTGEQFKAEDGRWVVFVNDDCYQVSDPFATPNALSNGMGVQTYCRGKSKTPRGDLFDQLPAYKKLHPDP
jgi:hypothetical protein